MPNDALHPSRPAPFPGLAQAPLCVLLIAGTAASQEIATLSGDAPGDRMGMGVAGPGDLDGDGVPDVVAGAPHADSQGTSSGAAKILSGSSLLLRATLEGWHESDRFGSAAAAAGDVDHDGRVDLLVGAPSGTPPAGEVSLFSGADLHLIASFAGDAPGDGFGGAVALAGDVDADGAPDWIVGARHASVVAPKGGLARVCSGATGATLFEANGGGFLDQLGYDVDGVGDVDGDGFDDFAVGAPLSDGGAMNGGEARCYAGGAFSLLWTIHGSGVADQLGMHVSGAGDLDGDGLPDAVFGAPAADGGGIDAGEVVACSGASGAVIWRAAGPHAGAGMGPCAALWDVDGDGRADVLAGAPGASGALPEAGRVVVLSGASGARLLERHGDVAYGWLGFAVASAGDLNGDGAIDFVAGAPGHDDHPELPGAARVLSVASLSLTTDGVTLSLAAGGSRRLSVDLGEAAAGWSFLILGSTGGILPGVSIAGTTLPLNPQDPYFLYTLAEPGSPPLIGALSTLDDAGRACAEFKLPPGLPASWAGITVHHAAIAKVPGKEAMSTPAVPVTLVP